MKRISTILGLWLAAMLVFSACEKKEDNVELNITSGAFIINEGLFQSNNGSLSFYNVEADSAANAVFMSVNGRSLGDALQSAAVYNDKVFMAVGNSNTVEVASLSTMTSTATVIGLSTPRYMEFADGKAFVSQWSNPTGSVAVIDLNSYTVTSTIEVGSGPEGIRLVNGKLWVANSGGYGSDSTLSIINPSTLAVEATVKVGDSPKEFAVDKDGNVWVLCSGKVIYDASWAKIGETNAKLVQLSATDHSIVKEIILPDGFHPSHMDISDTKDVVYYGGGYAIQGIYAAAIDATVAPATPLIDAELYGFNVDPNSGKILAFEATSLTQGTMNVYTAEGALVTTHKVGVYPNGAVFYNID